MAVHKIGVIGCGWVAPFHLAGLANLRSRAQIVWAADPVRERAEAIGHQVGARPLTDYREGLGEIDCAFVLLPHHLHHSVTLDCFKAGCHVFLEKPIATSLKQTDEMIAAAERQKKTLMVAYPHRYRKSMQLFKQILESGRYGKLFMLDGLMDEALQGYALGWISKRETLGGGVFFSSSPHMLDVMLWIGGDVQTASMVGTRGGIPMEGEDTAASVIKFKNGIIGVTRHTWASPRPRIWYTMNAVCEKAYITLTTTPLGNLAKEGHRCRWSTRIVAQPEEVLLESDEGLDFTPEIEHFFNCVETGERPQTDGYTARKVIELVFEAYRKAQAEGGNV
ncbi:MAG: Gfo/Idh/MocA family oxidoreductase [Acidobacteria bacterium]|nr:MAG: Gfo/Idh/MocA family oxidoreductase [Acidobacteriota bacterium]